MLPSRLIQCDSCVYSCEEFPGPIAGTVIFVSTIRLNVGIDGFRIRLAGPADNGVGDLVVVVAAAVASASSAGAVVVVSFHHWSQHCCRCRRRRHY